MFIRESVCWTGMRLREHVQNTVYSVWPNCVSIMPDITEMNTHTHTHHVRQKQCKQILMWPCWFWMVPQALPKPPPHTHTHTRVRTLTFALIQIHISCSVVKAHKRQSLWKGWWRVIMVLGEGVHESIQYIITTTITQTSKVPLIWEINIIHTMIENVSSENQLKKIWAEIAKIKLVPQFVTVCMDHRALLSGC